MGGSTFRILTVCTGNASRSPAVERLLRAGLGPTVSIESAGTAAVVGEPIAPAMASLLGRAGCDTAGFVARQVTADMLTRADLILALADENLDRTVRLVPSIASRVFTLVAFARIAAGVSPAGPSEQTPAQRLRRLVTTAPGTSGSGATQARADDVPDPFGHGQAAYERAFAEIMRATDVIIAAAGGGGGSRA